MHADIRSPRGIRVRVNERGLPLDLMLDEGALAAKPDELARHLFLLCRWGAFRAQTERADTVRAQGYSPETIRSLNLAKRPGDPGEPWPTQACTADVVEPR